MPYHIDYRPKDFIEYLGNENVKKSIQGLLEKENHPHTYLLYGESGCGKTTLARIMAAKLNCHNLDVFEINMSNNRGIDTARDLIDKAYLSAFHGKNKMYILDEVHKSTNEFQNAILKILEDTPKNTYFVLCTTEPNKILKTVRNRCSQFEIKKLDNDEIESLIEHISDLENIKNVPEIKKIIIKQSKGCARQALILLEKIASMGALDIEEIIESNFIFNEEKEEIITLCRRLLDSDSWRKIARILKNLEDDPEKIRRAVLGYCSAVLLNTDNPRAALIIEYFKDNFYDSGKAGLISACYNIFIEK